MPLSVAVDQGLHYVPLIQQLLDTSTKFTLNIQTANIVDPNKTAPEGAIWSGSALLVFQPALFRHILSGSEIAQILW